MPMAYTTLAGVLGPLGQRLMQSSVLIKRTDIPRRLFHYTNAAGLLGILNTSRLWATNYRFLNDSSEIGYGEAIFNSVVQERIRSEDKEVVIRFLEAAPRTANPFNQQIYDVYVCCLCEQDNLLHLWRAYAGSNGGFALGLDPMQMGKDGFETAPEQKFYLRKVIYNESKQRELIAEILDAATAVLLESTKGKSSEEARNEISDCCSFVTNALAEYLICFKHPAFEIEQEWRLCHVTTFGEGGLIQLRDGPYGLTPYIALDPTPRNGCFRNKLPLVQITHGPVANPDNVRYALAKLLDSKGYYPHGYTKIEGSTLPIRLPG